MLCDLLGRTDLLQQVRFVANQDLGDLRAAVVVHLLEPEFCLFEGGGGRDVEYDAGCLRQLEVVEHDGPVALLAGRVPQLQVERLVVYGYLLGAVVQAHCRLLGIERVVDVADQQSALPHCGAPHQDDLETFHCIGF